MVDFGYEYLPDYHCACAKIGHSTYECVKHYEALPRKFIAHELVGFTYAFAGLEGSVGKTNWYTCP